jgi:hypothetical protein
MELWQKQLLPWMITILVTSSLLFGVATIFQYNRIYNWMTAVETKVDDSMWSNSAVKPTNFHEQIELANARSAYALEQEVIRRNFQNTRQLVATRLWARFMGFLIGAILAIVGAAFILGRLSDQGNELSSDQPGLKMTLKSASPGIVLATLGTVLIAMSLMVQVSISNEIVPTYFAPIARAEAAYGDGAQPPVASDPAATEEAPPIAVRTSEGEK